MKITNLELDYPIHRTETISLLMTELRNKATEGCLFEIK